MPFLSMRPPLRRGGMERRGEGAWCSDSLEGLPMHCLAGSLLWLQSHGYGVSSAFKATLFNVQSPELFDLDRARSCD